jgi:radical SAM superfamily enzyme YgiQ (UPF0313 family)
MKVLFVVPEIRLDGYPQSFPFWAGILASIVNNKNGQVAILDLNALRMNFDGRHVPKNIIEKEISSEKWDIIGIGGLTTTYGRIKELSTIIKKCSPDSLFIGGGGWCTYNTDEILTLVPELDFLVIGEGEETFSEIYDAVNSGTQNFEHINGLCLRDGHSFKFTNPRALISDLDTIPLPAYDLFETEIYFRYSSSMPYSIEALNSKKRASVVWERGCPRGCTFCSHNGMSRIDLQNIYGEGDRKEGEKLVRISDKENNTFQLPARWPTPQYAINNIKLLKEKFDIDFLTIVDENMTSNLKWTKEFCELFINEGLKESITWGTLGDAPSVAVHPELVKIMKDAGCSYISFGFESASDKVLKEDIGKGQTRNDLEKTVKAIKEVGLTPITTFMIGNPHEDINDLMETVDFWITHNVTIEPFICTPYVGSPIYYNNKDFVLQQYDYRLKLLDEGKYHVSDEIHNKWKLEALDKFMKECGDAFQYTATVSQYFSIPELFALKQFMFRHDTRRMLRWAHDKYSETGLKQWKVSDKWKKYDPISKAQLEIEKNLKIINH